MSAKLKHDEITALKSLENRDGLVTAESIVEEARPKKNPLHNRFTWDDSVRWGFGRCRK